MKNILVIGSGSGMGKSLIKKLASEGHSVYTVSRHAAGSAVPSSGHLQIDLLEEEFPKEFLPEEVDGMVYFPGTINLKPIRALKEEDFLRDYEINVLGAIKVVRWILQRLSQGSSLVFLSSVAVQTGMPFHTMVSVSKGAVEGLSRALAAELAPKTRVNCVAPSLTQTPLSETVYKQRAKASGNERTPPPERNWKTRGYRFNDLFPPVGSGPMGHRTDPGSRRGHVRFKNVMP